MSEEIEQTLLKLLGDIPGVSKVGGGPVPLPSSSGEMIIHLFVNLTIERPHHIGDDIALLNDLRDLTFEVLTRLLRGFDASGHATICISLFVPISATDGIRIYRTRLKTQDLARLSRANFKETVIGEESGKPELRKLLRPPQ